MTIREQTFPNKLWQLARPYWSSEERWRARGLLAAIVALTLTIVWVMVRLNDWTRQFYNALEQHDYVAFKRLLLHFTVLAAIYITSAVYRLYLQQMLDMRWRVWLTRQYLGSFLDDHVYYRLELRHRGTDNPDQRIADDLRAFTSTTLTLSLGLFSATITLLSFIGILWRVSGPLTIPIGATGLWVPGYMVWAALVYAIVGSTLTHRIGRPLIGLNFDKERLEADFRFGLVRLRENAEGVALYGGERTEGQDLLGKFERIRQNWWTLMRITKRLTSFTVGYAQAAIIFPILVAAPRFFAGAITLGGLLQIVSAFGQVQNSMSWFVENYGSVAAWRASVDRLLTFAQAMEQAHREAASPERIAVTRAPVDAMRAEALDLELPDGRPLLTGADLRIMPGARVLVSGPSGAGKSTLFRALAGIWPFGRGRVTWPENATVLFLPQRPYIPIATLREAVSYPAPAGRFDDDAIREALRACRLPQLCHRLDERSNWALEMSLGEQQRLALTRAVLHEPRWLFLDEATASLDEATEAHVYDVVRRRLPGTTIVSVAHRPGVAAFHDVRLALVPDGHGARLVADTV